MCVGGGGGGGGGVVRVCARGVCMCQCTLCVRTLCGSKKMTRGFKQPFFFYTHGIVFSILNCFSREGGIDRSINLILVNHGDYVRATRGGDNDTSIAIVTFSQQ